MEEPPQPAPVSQDEHKTLVLTDPPPKKHHLVLWGFGMVAIAILLGMFEFNYWRIVTTTDNVSENIITTSQGSEERVQLVNTEDDSRSSYYREGENVYFGDDLISEADSPTFVALSIKAAAGGNDNEWAKDKNHVYDFGKVIEEADPSTFVTVYRGVMKDKNHIWLYGGTSANPESPIYGADSATFVHAGFDFYKDKNYVYNLEISEKLHADPITFSALSRMYAKDINNVYAYWYKPLIGSPTYKVIDANPNTFQIFEGEYGDSFGRDQSHVYAFGEIIEGADPLSFQILPPVNSHLTYVKDVYAVYAYFNERYSKINNADTLSFSLVEGQELYDAQDKNHKYVQGVIIE